ncbi:MAG: CDP-glycerol glycerophosphotransferase family protein [Angustibacter sp.]
MKGLLARLTGRQPSPVLVALRYRQVDAALELHFTTRPDVMVGDLWWQDPAAGTWRRAGTCQRVGDGYEARVELSTDLAGADPEGVAAQLYVDVEHDLLDADDASAVTLSPHIERRGGPGERARYRRRFGQFADTDGAVLLPVRQGDHDAAAYVSRGGYLAVAVDRPLKPFTDVLVRWLSVRDGRLVMTGRLSSRHEDLTSAELQLRGRTSGQCLTVPVRFSADAERTRRTYGHRWYRFEARGDLQPLLDEPDGGDDIFDAWFVLTSRQQPEPFSSRVGKTRFLTRRLTRPGWMTAATGAAAVTPYYTFKGLNTSFQVDRFELQAMAYLRRQLRWRHVVRARHLLSRTERPLWLVGERPNKAQDTGLALFRHLREHHPELDAYYVMDPEAPDFRNVAPYGNVLAHRSVEHIHATLKADRVLGSHHPDFVYPLRTKRFGRAVRATRIFLQHGVMGTKWMVPNYGKGVGDFRTDLFVVSSEREKQYIVSDFGFDADEVAVTGLSRFDSLLADDVEKRRQLLILPTWRDWLQDEEAYLASEYHERWSELLHHPRLRELEQQHGFEVVFALHPNMAQFTHLFSDAPARVVNFGELDVQHLLKSSAMLVTDYSSVGFDFSFLHRPVVYYQFDQQRFLGPRGSHLDLDAELPGPIVFRVGALLSAIEAVAADDFAMAPEYVRRADRFITHRDRSNSARIVAAAKDAHRQRLPWRRVAWRRRWRTSDPRLNRRRYWFPLMRVMFRIAQRLPADDRRVVFESGVGKQYADSPRYVYEELMRRGVDVKAVWAYAGQLHDLDRRTTVVDRLSPAYFYHLARARYWVNNQNFPHYVQRRADGVYLQTWHGTPLKRMLHDLDVVHGRDAGYLDRVTEASAQWSLLTSPSPFATQAMRSAFRYEGEVLEVGYPRNDVFFHDDREAVAARVRRRLGIAPDKKVVLYAPTFRDDQSLGGSAFAFRLPLDLDRVHERLGDDVVLLLRMHVLVRQAVTIPPHLSEHVVDASSFPEIQELFLASDALITDYSSVFFDFANLRRPMVFYAYDLEAYRDNLRGFYLDYVDTVPGPVVTTEDDLLDALSDLDSLQRKYSDRYDAFIARFSPHDDGDAAARVVDRVFGPLL